MATQTKENYLKAILFLSKDSEGVSITDLSETMNVSKPTVNSMVKKLQEKDWIKYEKYKPLVLTSKGRKEAGLIIRKHRLSEMFLSKIMGFGWEEVHDIAEEIEHLKSKSLFDRMDEILGFPTKDPHGSPIPDKNGKITPTNFQNLLSVSVGQKIQLRGLTSSSKDLLIYLNKKQIKLGTVFTVLDIEDFDKSFELKLENGNVVNLSHSVSQCLLVEAFI